MEKNLSLLGHLAVRVVLTVIGVAFLWYGSIPASVSGLILMLVGLVLTVTGLFAGDVVRDRAALENARQF